jgi:hypothetical protein
LEEANHVFLREAGALTHEDAGYYASLIQGTRDLFTVGELSCFAPLWHQYFRGSKAGARRIAPHFNVRMNGETPVGPFLKSLPPHLGLMRHPDPDDGLLGH